MFIIGFPSDEFSPFFFFNFRSALATYEREKKTNIDYDRRTKRRAHNICHTTFNKKLHFSLNGQHLKKKSIIDDRDGNRPPLLSFLPSSGLSSTRIHSTNAASSQTHYYYSNIQHDSHVIPGYEDFNQTKHEAPIQAIEEVPLQHTGA